MGTAQGISRRLELAAEDMANSGRGRVIGECGREYLERGWKLVTMPDGRKAPVSPNWNTASELIDSPEKLRVALADGPRNLGLYHRLSQTAAVDIDDEKWTRFVFGEFGLEYDSIVGSGMRIWSREGRDKVVFGHAPSDLTLRKVSWPMQGSTEPRDLFTLFELRAGNCQDVLGGSKHPMGHMYRWWPGTAPWELDELPAPPEELLDFWRALANRKSGLADEIQGLCAWRAQRARPKFAERVRSASADHSDVIGKFNAANDIGEMLQHNGYKKRGNRYLAPGSSTLIPGVVLLEDKCYSHHGSDPLADGYAHDAFDLLVTLEHGGDVGAALRDAAQQLGIERHAPKRDIAFDASELEAVMAAQAVRLAAKTATASVAQRAAIGESQAPVQVIAIPEVRTGGSVITAVVDDPVYLPHLFRPPGMAGTITDWILETSMQPQPILAVVGALALLSVVLGQKVASDTNARTNNYFVAIAETGFGKEHNRNCIKTALRAIGFDKAWRGERIASGAGVMSAAQEQPVCVFLLDEFGKLMQAMASRNAGNHEREIGTSFVTLFSSSTNITKGTEYADKRLNALREIKFPNVCILGTTVPKSFFDSLAGADISGGFLNRFMVVEAPSLPPPFTKATLRGVPTEIVDWLKAARSIMPGLEDIGEFPLIVPNSPQADNILLQFRTWVQARGIELRANPARAPLADLWARSVEHAIKLALVLACASERDPAKLAKAGETKHLEIDTFSMQWAIDFVMFTTARMEYAIETRVGDSDLDRKCQATLRAFAKARERGCTIADLNTNCWTFRGEDPRGQDTIIEMLKRRGAIVPSQRPAKMSGQPTTMVWVVPEFLAASGYAKREAP